MTSVHESPVMIDIAGLSDTIAAPMAQLFIMHTRLVLLLLHFLVTSLPSLILALTSLMQKFPPPAFLWSSLEVWLSMDMTSSRERKKRTVLKRESQQEKTEHSALVMNAKQHPPSTPPTSGDKSSYPTLYPPAACRLQFRVMKWQ